MSLPPLILLMIVGVAVLVVAAFFDTGASRRG
jgi:hypothetical protein